MNAPGLLELVIILFLAWAFLGPQKMAKGAKALGKAYREFRGYTLGSNKLPKNDKVRSSAERLGIDGLLIHTKLHPTHSCTQASIFRTQDVIPWLDQHIPKKTGL